MKRNLLAVAVPALLMAGAANASIEIWNQDGNKVELEGRAKAVSYITKKGNSDGEGDHSEARLGFISEARISDGLTGYAHVSWQTSADQDDSKGAWNLESRYAFAGLNFGDLGSIDYGRNDGLIKGVGGYTDVLPEFGGDSPNRSYYLLANRKSGLVTYRNSNLFGLVDGLQIALQYSDSLDATDKDGKKLDGKYTREAYAAGFDYALLNTGVFLSGAYAESAGKNYNRTWATGLKYDANNLLIAANYFQSSDKTNITEASDAAKKYWGFEVVAQYGIDFEVGRIVPSVAYIQHKQKHVSGEKRGDLIKYVEVGASYWFNKNIAAIVDYKINLLKDKDLGPLEETTSNTSNAYTKDTVGIGLVYEF